MNVKNSPKDGCSSPRVIFTKKYPPQIGSWGRLFLFIAACDKREHRDTKCNGIDKYPNKSKQFTQSDIHRYHLLPELSGRKQKSFFSLLPKRVDNP